MKFFAQSLGVRCTFCHVGIEGQPLSTFDFASDAKKEKLTARKMLVMVHRINSQDFGIQIGRRAEGDLLHLSSRRDEAADRAAVAKCGPGRCSRPGHSSAGGPETGTRRYLSGNMAGPLFGLLVVWNGHRATFI